jgi:hypothetical protein
LDQATGTAGLDLAAQLKNEYIHGVASDLSIGSPNRLDKAVSGYNPTGSAHDVFEENEFRACQDQRLLPTVNLAGLSVERKIGNLQKTFALDCTAACDYPQARGKYFEREWFGEVIIRTYVETAHNIRHRIAGSQHQNGHSNPSGAEAPRYGETVQAWQHNIQHNRIELRVLPRLQSLDSVRCDFHSMTLRHETTAEQLSHLGVIVNNQDPHIIL